MLPGARSILALILLAGSPAFAQTSRYELFPEPEVRQSATNRTASAHVVDAARYDFRDLTANNGDCLTLPADVRRPSFSETCPTGERDCLDQRISSRDLVHRTDFRRDSVLLRCARPGACVKLTLP